MMMSGTARSTLLLLLLWSNVGWADDGRLLNFFRESWTTRDGLPHNTINGINQAADGYLWLSTWEGAVRFNGREFKSFGRGPQTGLLDNGVFAINACGQDLLVADARGGISRLSNNSWQAVTSVGTLIRSMHCDAKGNLWIGTEGQGVYVETASGQRLHFDAASGLTDQSIFKLLEDNAGRMWIATAQGLFVLEQTQLTAMSPSTGLPLGPVFDLALDSHGVLLAATESGLYQWLDDRFVARLPQLNDKAISCILVDGQDQLWLGTVGNGLYRHSQHGLEHLGSAEGLPNRRVTALFKDRENSLWIGTNGGLFRLRDAPFRAIGEAEGLSDNFVRVVMAHQDGSLWIGNSKGVDVLRDNSIRKLPGQHADETILSLAQDPRGGVWIGTFTSGLFRWQEGHQQEHITRQQGLAANEVRAILPAADGSIWVGTSRGVNRISDKGTQTFTREHGLPSNFVATLHQTEDGRVWIGTATGVAYWQAGQFQTLDIRPFEEAEFVFGFFQDEGSEYLWLVTDRGLIRLHLPSGQMQSIGRGQGLPFDKFFQMLADQQGNYWISSNRGMLRLQRQQVEEVLAGSRKWLDAEIFDESDGMYSAQANGGSTPAAALTADGALWFATAKGVATIQPRRLSQFSRVSPPVVLENIMVDGKALTPRHNLVLEAGASRIQFEFAGLGFIMPERIQYQTRLEGFDSQWISRHTQTVTEFTNLAPGDYRFLVRARYPNGEWSDAEAAVDIYLPPYLWQRPGFWIMMLALGIALLGLSVRWRLRGLRRFNRLLQKQVARQTRELRHTADSLRQADSEKSALLAELKHQSQAFERQARQDPLTGLANRRAFDEALQREYARAVRQGRPLCLLLLDLDHFKRINDQWSHNIGDRVLKQVAQTIQAACRETDVAARWGGEEFSVLLPDTDLINAEIFAQRLRHNLSRLDFSDVANGLTLTTSIGLATIADCEDADTILQRADAALYQAKESGRNRVCMAN